MPHLCLLQIPLFDQRWELHSPCSRSRCFKTWVCNGPVHFLDVSLSSWSQFPWCSSNGDLRCARSLSSLPSSSLLLWQVLRKGRRRFRLAWRDFCLLHIYKYNLPIIIIESIYLKLSISIRDYLLCVSHSFKNGWSTRLVIAVILGGFCTKGHYPYHR